MTLAATLETQPRSDTNDFIVHEQPAPPKKVKQPFPLIDVDVHHQSDKSDVLFPYLSRHYVEWIKDFGSMMPGIGYTNMPGNGARHDLWDGKDINPATDPNIAIKDHLDKYGINLAVLTGGPYSAAVHPDADYATAYCRAFNTWTAQEWIAKDTRFRASIHIAPQDPEQAVAEIERLADDLALCRS